MRIFSIKLILILLSFIIAFNATTCFWSPYMEYEMLFDRNFVFSNSKKINTYNTWFYDVEKYNSTNSNLANARSWANYFENVYSVVHLKDFIYRSSSDFSNFDKEFKKLIAKRLITKDILKKEKFFIEYMELALGIENLLSTSTADVWSETEPELDLEKFELYISKVTTKLNNSADSFQKERLAYQLIKLYRYSKNYSSVLRIFENQLLNSNSLISYWAMEHYAGALLKLGYKNKANYYFTKVYVNCISKRMSSYFSISINSEEDFQSTLDYCKTTEEKMAIHYIRAMRSKNNGLDDMKTINSNLGNHEYSQLIMTHEINKLEKILLDREPDENDQTPEYQHLILFKSQIPNYLKELISYNQEMNQKNPNDNFWRLTLAYLYYLNNQNAECSEQLSTIKSNDNLILKQHDVIYIVNYLETKNQLTKEDENIIGEKLFKINNNKPFYPYLSQAFSENNFTNESFLTEEYNTINEYLFKKIREKFNANNQFISLIFSGSTISSDLYLEELSNNEDKSKITIDYISDLLDEIKKTPETKLTLFAASYYFDIEKNETIKILDFKKCEFLLKEFKATLLMRNPDNLTEAIDLLTDIPVEIKNSHKIYGDPIYFSIKNPIHETNISKSISYTKLDLAKKLYLLNNNNSTAKDYFDLGLAYYNLSYYGLQWYGLSYFRSSVGPNGNYLMDVSEDYFNKALKSTNLSPELVTSIYIMLAKCQLNSYTQKNGEIPSDYYNQNSIELDFTNYILEMYRTGNQSYFEKIKNTCTRTLTYQKIIKECKYFNYYIN